MRFAFIHHTNRYRIDLIADRLLSDPHDDCMGSKWQSEVIAKFIEALVPDTKLGADSELCINQLIWLKKLCDEQIQYIETGDL